MQVIFERYETAGNMTRTETLTIEDTKWTGDGGFLELNWDDLAAFELLEEGGYDE